MLWRFIGRRCSLSFGVRAEVDEAEERLEILRWTEGG